MLSRSKVSNWSTLLIVIAPTVDESNLCPAGDWRDVTAVDAEDHLDVVEFSWNIVEIFSEIKLVSMNYQLGQM